MTDDEFDDALRTRFEGLRRADAREAPPFAEMVARARAAAMPPAAPAPVLRRRRSWAFIAAPLAAAAGLALWLAPGRAADREFERAVSEWSRTERALASPTDGLLAVPGSEYLRRLPIVGSGAAERRRPT